ncbi:MAG: 30S ribosomal protein S12 methylthiotransferase RimO [Clostridia bacterium]|nr:30S ribosomal protein S12 methylthiotransferase RimO [Clostridia bacterium]
MRKKIGFISLGCPKNQIDGERMLASLTAAGYELCEDIDGADAVLVNTCAFIEDAKKEAIESILDMVSMKEDGMIGKVVVTGCLAERYRQEIMKEIPEVDAVCGLGANGDVVRILDELLATGEKTEIFPKKTELPENGDRILTTPSHYAYLKIAEGCSNGCSYCVIPRIRGPFRSRPKEDVLAEAETLAAQGVKELIVVAQDTGRYGEDLYGTYSLAPLLKRIADIDGIEWIRLLYCYPERITDELLDAIAYTPKILHYIDIPFQHADPEILRQMGRPGGAEEYLALLKKIRAKIPDVTIRTSLIAGFPGETEEQFTALSEFVKAARFDRMGCFPYSREEGTLAYGLPGQLDEQTKLDRAEIINEQQGIVTEKVGADKIGTTQRVIVEGYDGYSDSYVGRSGADAPEIDREVKFTAKKELNEGDIVDVYIFDETDGDLIGVVKF